MSAVQYTRVMWGNVNYSDPDTTDDGDRLPQRTMINGSVLFRPMVDGLITYSEPLPTGETVKPRPHHATLIDGVLYDAADDVDVWLLSCSTGSRTGWTWRVTLTPDDGGKPDTFDFRAEGAELNLATVVPVASSGGTPVIVGPGVPEGGTIGQALVKASAADFDTIWSDVASGGGGTGVGGVVHTDNPTGPRPTDRTDVMVIWIGGTTRPAAMIDGDLWFAEGEPPAAVAPAIVSTALGGMTVGVAFSQTLTATGTTPITWSVASGAFPAGVSMSSAGVVSGTPTAAGSYSVTVRATNSAGNATRALSGSVAATASAPVIDNLTIPGLTVGETYTQTLSADSGTAPINWSYTGTLPAGMTLSSSGTFTGTPTTAGTASFTVTATNAQGSDSKAFTVTTAAAPVGGAEHYVWSTPPDTPTLQTDGTPNIEVATGFVPLAGSTGWTITGARVYVPAGASPSVINVKLYKVTTNAPPTLGSGYIASGTISAPVPGQWNTGTFDVTTALTTGEVYYVSYDTTDGTYYYSAPTLGDNYVQASDGSPFALSATFPFGTDGAWRYHFRIGTGAVAQPGTQKAIWYGTDIIVTEP